MKLFVTYKSYFILLVLVFATSAQNNVFRISYNRVGSQDNINEVILSCIGNSVPLSDAQYFRNGAVFNKVFRDRDTAAFIASRVTEGNFSCGRIDGGTVTMGSAIPILALPDGTIRPSIEPSYRRMGSKARLNCSITPSQIFLNQYGVKWINSSNPSDVFYSLPAGFPDGTGKSQHYHLDPKTFALFIDNVQPLDAVTDYKCVLSVRDIGIQQQLYTFDETALLNLSIIVFAPPAFTLLPVPVTIAQGKQANATFHCEVRSSPEPSHIVWFYKHGSVEMQIRESSLYHVENSTTRGGGSSITQSEVSVIEVNGFSSGEIRCEAQYVAFISNKEMVLETRSTSTTLAVLSRPTDIETISAENGGFIIRITLSDALPIPIAVQIRFLDADSDGVMRSLQSDVFMNTRTITTYRDSVPFTRFTMRVGVVHETIRSPLFRDDVVHERSNDEKEVLIYKILSICEGFVIVLLIFVFMVMACTTITEAFSKKDDGHVAEKIFSKVNSKRRRNLMMAPMYYRRKRARNDSQKMELVPQEEETMEGDSETVVEAHITPYGITDKLSKEYVEGLNMAIKFGKADPKIKKVLADTKETSMLVPTEASVN